MTDTGKAFSLAFVIDFELQGVYHQLLFILTSVQATGGDIWCVTTSDQSHHTLIASAVIFQHEFIKKKMAKSNESMRVFVVVPF